MSARAAPATARRAPDAGARATRRGEPPLPGAARRARSGRSACSGVRLTLPELDEEPVRVLRVDPGDVRAASVDPDPGLLQALDAPRNVVALEAHEIDAFAVLGEEPADRFVRVGRLQQLDVADPRREDRVLEPELLRLRAMVNLEPEEAAEPLDRGVQVSHHDRQLDDIAQHETPPWTVEPDHTVESPGSKPDLHAPFIRRTPVLLWLVHRRRGLRHDGHRRQRAHALLLVMRQHPAPTLLYLMVASQGVLGYGLASVFGAIPAELFQGKHYGTIFGTLSLASIVGGAIGPWVAGALHDRTGSYVLAFWLAIGASVVSAVAMWLAAPRKVRAVAGRVPRGYKTTT